MVPDERPCPPADGRSQLPPLPERRDRPLDRGYAWPNAGFVNLARIKQAAWDAFAGTAQPTTVDGLRLYLDEVGWQVDTTGRTGYDGAENVAVTTKSQAAVYGELVRRAACDPDVAQVNVTRDDALRTGFQAGLIRADGSARPSADAVRAAVAEPGCASAAGDAWRPSKAVLGAKPPVVKVTPTAIKVDVTAIEGASARVCLLPGSHSLSSARRLLAGRTAPVGCTTPPSRRTDGPRCICPALPAGSPSPFGSRRRRPRRGRRRSFDRSGRAGQAACASRWRTTGYTEHVFCQTTNTCS